MYDPRGLYVDPLLSGFSVGWQPQQLYGSKLFPMTPVKSQSARYRVFDRSHWLIYPARREPGTEANTVVGRKWSEDQYKTVEKSLQSDVFWEEREQLNSLGGLGAADEGVGLEIDPDADALDTVMTSLFLDHEKRVADTLRLATNYASNHKVTLAGNTKWSDYTYVTPGLPESIVSNPIGDIKTAVMRIYLDTGRWPNTFIIPADALGVIEGHPRVVDRYKNFALTDPEAWKKILNVPYPENFFVVDSKYNTASSIDAAESIASFWGQDAWIGLVDPTPGQRTMTFGKTFVYPYEGFGEMPVEKWSEIKRKTDVVRCSWRWDLKIVSALAGYLFINAVAPVT
jgi:hypothetical protein